MGADLDAELVTPVGSGRPLGGPQRRDRGKVEPSLSQFPRMVGPYVGAELAAASVIPRSYGGERLRLRRREGSSSVDPIGSDGLAVPIAASAPHAATTSDGLWGGRRITDPLFGLPPGNNPGGILLGVRLHLALMRITRALALVRIDRLLARRQRDRRLERRQDLRLRVGDAVLDHVLDVGRGLAGRRAGRRARSPGRPACRPRPCPGPCRRRPSSPR